MHDTYYPYYSLSFIIFSQGIDICRDLQNNDGRLLTFSIT